MDNLVLTRLSVEWSSTLVPARLSVLEQRSADRFRLVFACEPGDVALSVCLDPRKPWVGREIRRWEGPRWSPDPFVTAAAHALVGRGLAGVVKDPPDRTIRLDFGDGQGLVIELAPHGANLVVLGRDATVVSSLRRPKGAEGRLTPGRPFAPRGFPAGRLDPFRDDPERVDAAIDREMSSGEPAVAALQRSLVGVGAVGAELVVDEHLATGRSLATILRSRLDDVLAGVSEVLIEGPDDPAGGRLLPWRPITLRSGCTLVAHGSPAETAAFFYETQGVAERTEARIAALGRILRAELNRTSAAESKVRDGLSSFADPDRYRVMGEALLASLGTARRTGDVVMVPNPYDPDGREISIPAAPDRPLAQVANELFEKQRRSKRGLKAASARAAALEQRSSQLLALLVVHERTRDEPGAAVLEAQMRAAGLAVGLVGPTRAARSAARVTVPRLEGVRMVTSADGWTILVGRTGRDNDKLTFKIGAPEDLWLHAAGVPGAHVIIRNPERRSSVPPATLTEAAQLALWFSEARSEAAGDVQWTRRKNVRRAKGDAPGRVVLKRFETIRVRPRRPSEDV